MASTFRRILRSRSRMLSAPMLMLSMHQTRLFDEGLCEGANEFWHVVMWMHGRRHSWHGL